jgi:hypothetical protein
MFFDRLKALPVVMLIFLAYLSLPNSFTQTYGDAAFTALLCLGCTLYASHESYFLGSIPALGRRRRRNLVINWTGLLASVAVGAAFAQHESYKGKLVEYRSGRYIERSIVFGVLVFFVTYFILWLGYRILTRSDSRLPQRSS